MAGSRPTFSESWSRVADLRARLQPTAQAQRQWFRGRPWWILRDAASNQHFRVSSEAYNFLGRLDGERTVDQAWRISIERDGDDAVTQPEALDLLTRLYGANLLAVDRPGDARALFERRRKRVSRETKGHLQSVLFARLPLFDPDAMLTRWRPVVGWLFSPLGLLLWSLLVIAGFVALVGRFDTLVREASAAFDPDNLLLLYLAYVVLKGLHELGHGFACKQFGVKSGGERAGEVHSMGIALLVFMPVPYVDASSAWSLRSRTQRIVVSMAGMFVELACAAIAAIVWVNTGPGSLTHALSANVIVLASVSALLFNGNPLLRYDAYYALSDMLDVPNMWQRSREQMHHYVKRFVFGVRTARSPAYSAREALLLTLYGATSSIYRVFISVAIILFLASKFFIIGVILALLAVVLFVVVPLGKFVRYLTTNPELTRVRPRAQIATLAFTLLLLTAVGLVPVPAHVRLHGFVESSQRQVVRAGVEGFLSEAALTGRPVRAGERLATLESASIESQLRQARAQRDEFRRRLDVALTEEPSAVGPHQQRLGAIEGRIARLEREREALDVRSTVTGVWVAPRIDDMRGAFVERGERLGEVVSLDDLRVRARADQASVGALTPLRETLDREAGRRLRIRVDGRPAESHKASGFRINAAATRESDRENAEEAFEVIVPAIRDSGLMPGQRVVVRVRLDDAPIAQQAITAFRRLIQRRFQV